MAVAPGDVQEIPNQLSSYQTLFGHKNEGGVGGRKELPNADPQVLPQNPESRQGSGYR